MGLLRPLILALLALLALPASAQEPAAELPAGLRNLYTRAYQDFSLTPAEFDRLWTQWPAELRAVAAQASPAERRRLALERYGLPLDPRRSSDVPAAFADPGEGRWVLNCLACHQGTVGGEFVPGLGNTRFAFRTLIDDYLWLRRAEQRRSAFLEEQFGFVSLGESDGTTNAQVFSALLAALRTPDLALLDQPRFTHVVSHDLDAPPLWHLAKKQRLYADGYIDKHPRVAMQFALAVENEAEEIKGWEPDFAEVLAWAESLKPPAYPRPVDAELAARGQVHFEEVCADCHGTYGEDPSFPERRIPLADLGTDPQRARGLSREFRQWMKASWLGREGEADVLLDPDGYMAPPLDGLWATAPYLHNGSVPTLYHLLFPDERPVRWRRRGHELDWDKAGLAIDQALPTPGQRLRHDQSRRWFDTRRAGKSAAGHRYPEALDPAERLELLEYLKTL